MTNYLKVMDKNGKNPWLVAVNKISTIQAVPMGSFIAVEGWTGYHHLDPESLIKYLKDNLDKEGEIL